MQNLINMIRDSEGTLGPLSLVPWCVRLRPKRSS